MSIMKETNKFTQICSFAVGLIFLLCSAFVTFEAFTSGGADKIWQIVLIVFSLEVFYLFNGIIKKNAEKADKLFEIVFIIYLAVMFFVQTLPSQALRFTPAWDLDAVYGGAISWINNGNMSEYNDYFLWFPNNFGLLMIYRGVFGAAHIFGGDNTDYFSAAVLMGSISLTLTRFSVIMLCKKLLGTRHAYLAMLLMLMCPPMYFMGIAFYTDVLSMWSPVTCLMFFVYGRQSEKISKKIVFYILSALAAAAGSEIKFTVVIMSIAIAISLLIRLEWKDLAIFAAAQVIVTASITAAFNGVYYTQFSREQAKIQNTPLAHWFMMGVKGEGRYNGEDYDFTRSFDDVEERSKALREEIVRRYKERGLNGTLDLWKAKTDVDYTDGTFGISDFLDDGIEERNILQQWLLYDGENYGMWKTLCNSVYVVVLFMLTASVWERFSFKKKKQDGGAEVFKLAENSVWLNFIGLWLFLMLWEASPRYFSNSLGVMLVSAVMGADCAGRMLSSLRARLRLAYLRGV